MSSEEQLLSEDVDTASGASDKWSWLLLLAAIVVAIIPYSLNLFSPPLLDEQFLLSWLTHMGKLSGSSSMSGFFAWPGFDVSDRWGPLTHGVLWIQSLLFGDKLFFYRSCSVLLHALSGWFLYRICRLAGAELLQSIAAGLVFLLYPLNSEAVAWLGGIGSQLSVLLFLASFSLYLSGQAKNISWGKLGLALLLFVCSLAASIQAWTGALVVVAFAVTTLVFAKNERKQDATQAIIPVLLYVVIAGVCLAANGITFFSSFDLSSIGTLCHRFFLPINQTVWQRYSKEYVAYYLLAAPTALSLIVGLCLCAKMTFRRNVIFALLWLLLALVPLSGLSLTDPSLYGSRWLYFASLPLSLLVAYACTGIGCAFERYKKPLLAVSCLLLLAFGVMYFKHLWNQNSAYRNSARILRAVQSSVSIASSKSNLSFLILRDMPRPLSIAPAYSIAGPVCIDTSTGLLRSNPVPDGRLKDLLAQGKYKDCALRWESNLQSFIPLELTPEQHSWLPNMTPADFAGRLNPGLIFYKTVSLDEQEGVMVLQTNSAQGPMIILTASELSPLSGDYLVLEARMTAPPNLVSPKIELHWQTNVHEDFDKKERYAHTRAIVNDGKYHTYHLSLRSNGWTTGGRPKVFALGFPSGAKVELKRTAVVAKTGLLPELTALSQENPSPPRYTPPYYNYPSVPELGLVALADSAKAITAQYSVAAIPDAEGVLVEISKANRSFDDANGDHLSSVTLKTLTVNGKEGSLSIPFAELDGPGVYSIRVIGVNARGFYRGMFSDALSYQVPLTGKQ
ncbi:MAG: hypothetical protein K2W82_00360 [Candidatus Obscuribacterales bacterium]|nr:hypothetical protein [Candidatus Obscuribacterales bacterium]